MYRTRTMRCRGGVGGIGLGLMLVACHARPQDVAPDARGASDAAGPASVAVQATTGPIVLDGEWLETDWDLRTTQLVFTGDDGQQARPYSEIRFLRDATSLYVGMYAADEDIEATDFFQVTIGTLDLRVDPRGRVTASASGLAAVSEVEGTVDAPGDYDEEWVVEMSVPLALMSLGPTPTTMRASRCDVTTDQVLRCGSTTAELFAADLTAP
jgi:hypothetical protein